MLTNIYSDCNFIVTLSAEHFINHPEHLSKNAQDGWQLFLAEARKDFLVDELLFRNHLETSSLAGEIFEVDGGTSKLGEVLTRSNLRVQVTNLYEPLEISGNFALGVTHNQLEHLSSLEAVDDMLAFMQQRSFYGMVHQVHANDELAFNWDKSHNISMKGAQWEEYFNNWADLHSNEGWSYLGAHRGMPGRPQNFVLEKKGSLPFYSQYDEQLIRKIIAELTVSNAISISRIPLLLLSFSLAKDNPYLLSGLVGVVHALDALDGYAARKGFGQSPIGPFVDVLSDHLIESLIFFEYAYANGYLPIEAPWIITARNLSTDILRLHNAFKAGLGTSQSHPHEGFGTTGREGRMKRALYGFSKAVGDMIIPVIPQLGLYVSAAHIIASFSRAVPVWTSPTSQKIYREVLDKIKKRKS